LHTDHLGSDHKPLVLHINVPNVTPTAIPQPVPYLKWNYTNQPQYCMALNEQEELWEQVRQALDNSQIDMAATLLASITWNAAARAHMVIDPNAPKSCKSRLKLPRSALLVQRAIRNYRKQGLQVPAHLRAQWRQIIFLAKREQQRGKRKRMRHLLRLRPRAFWTYYCNRAAQSTSGISIDQWADYYRGKFGASATHDKQTHAPQPRSDTQECNPLCAPVESHELVKAFKSLGTAKCPGIDRVPAEFITKANIGVNPFQPTLMAMFDLILGGAPMPGAWKVKCIHPVYKAGGRGNPDNYRPIAVATTFYRIFTSILGHRLGDFELQDGTLLMDHQFAFRKQFSVEHNHLVILTARDLAHDKGKPLVILKLDVSKAYDTVDRCELWDTMHKAGLPHRFIQVIQGLYQHTQYVVWANGLPSTPFLSTTGLLQGCALSPMLYNIYLKPCLQLIHDACNKDGIGASILRHSCVALNYADDIQALLHSIEHVPIFMQHVQRALQTKNQYLNIDKCRALLLGYNDAHIPTPMAGVKVVESEKILGIWYESNGSLQTNLEYRETKGRSKLPLIMTRLTSCGCRNDTAIAPLILNTDLRATLMFGAGLWGAYGLSSVDPMTHRLQRPYSTLMRAILGVPATCGHWITSLLLGQLPIQYHIIKEFCRLWNRLLSTAEVNPLVYACLQVQNDLLARQRTCWLKRWHDRLRCTLPHDDFRHIAHALGTLQPIQHKAVMKSLSQWYDCRLHQCGDPSIARCPHRRTAMVYRNFHVGQLGKKPAWHRWEWDELPERVWRSWISFVSANSCIPVHEQQNMDFSERLCTKCSLGEVGDEYHVVFRCTATLSSRQKFRDALVWTPRHDLFLFWKNNMCKPELPLFVHDVLTKYLTGGRIPGCV
jgi:hypothetical protein